MKNYYVRPTRWELGERIFTSATKAQYWAIYCGPMRTNPGSTVKCVSDQFTCYEDAVKELNKLKAAQCQD